MAAGQDYRLNITGNAEKTLQATQKAAASLSTTMDRLGKIVAGVAVTNFVRQTQQLAATMTNLSAATGVSVKQIAAFTNAMSVTGANADRAKDAISDLTKNIGGAVGGSAELQKAFSAAGVSLSDLATLSEADIFAKTIEGLSKIPDGATRSSTAMKLLGESVKGVDIQKLNAEFGVAGANVGSYASSIKAASDANASIAKNMQNFTQALTNVLKPINELIANLNVSVGAFESLIRIAIAAGGAILIFTGGLSKLNAGFDIVAKSLQYVTGRGKATGMVFQEMAKDLSGMTGTWTRFGKSIMSTTEATVKFRTLILSTVFGLARLATRLLGVIGIVIAVGEALNAVIRAFTGFDTIDWVLKKLGAGWDWVKNKLGIFKEEVNQSEAETQRLARAQEAATKADRWAEINKRVAEYALGIQNSVQAYKDQAAAARAAFEQETKSIGLSEEQRIARESLFQAEQTYFAERKKLEQELQKLQQSGTDEDRLKAQETVKSLADLDAAYKQNAAAIQTNVDARIAALRADALKKKELKDEIDLYNKLQKVQDDIARSTLTELERKYYDIAAAARDSAKAAIEEEEARRGVKLSLAEMDQYYSRAAAGAKKLIEAEKKAAESNRTFSSGWQKAFKQYVEDAGDAAATAAKLFGQFTQGIEDALVDFVKTGKLNWRTFVADMAETLLRSQIKQTIASIGSALGMGGLFGGQGGSGAGSSPNNPLYVIDIAGGNATVGPANPISNLISGGGIGGGQGSGFANTIKTVASTVSNIAGGVGTAISNIGSSIWDTVSSIGSSIGDFFGGFFANGGTLGAGKWGIAGENGPELISGPATVTPMAAGGGSTVVTYNINAVDAASFKSMIAADPSFLFAVTEQGRRGLPGGRK